jgi:hypothetical protein
MKIRPVSIQQRNNNSSGFYKKLLNSICGQNAEVLCIKPSGKYSSHYALEGTYGGAVS